jgi:hypothetical protein
MSFSIKAILVGTLFFGIWFAVVWTGNRVGFELATVATMFAILLTLPLAIFDEDLDRRPFWCGFFVMGFGFYLAAYNHVSEVNLLGHRLAEFAATSPQSSHLQLIAESFPYLFCLIAGTVGGVITSVWSRAD